MDFSAVSSSSPFSRLPRSRSAAARRRLPTPFVFGFFSADAAASVSWFGSVLAADQLDLRDFRAVTTAVADSEDSRVAARPRLEARGNRIEQLADHVAIVDVAQDHPSRVQRPAVFLAAGKASLGNRDDSFDERPQLLGARHGGLDPLELQQRLRLVAQHGDAMLGDAA